MTIDSDQAHILDELSSRLDGAQPSPSITCRQCKRKFPASGAYIVVPPALGIPQAFCSTQCVGEAHTFPF